VTGLAFSRKVAGRSFSKLIALPYCDPLHPVAAMLRSSEPRSHFAPMVEEPKFQFGKYDVGLAGVVASEDRIGQRWL